MRGSKRQRKKKRIGTRRRRIELMAGKCLHVLARSGVFTASGLPAAGWPMYPEPFIIWTFTQKETP